MKLKAGVVAGIAKQEWGCPTELEERAISCWITQGDRDMIVQSPSAVERRRIYCIAILQSIDPEVPSTQVLVLVPTRELARKVCVLGFDLMKIIVYFLSFE
jgi:superfamily II DNA/RNA helicase